MMKALALRDVKWDCLGTIYECKAGEEVIIDPSHIAHAKASRLFKIEEKTTRKKKAD